MKIQRFYRKKWCLLIVFVLSLLGLSLAQANQTNIIGETNFFVVRSAETNEISGWLQFNNNFRFVSVGVKIRSHDLQFTNAPNRPFWWRFKYFMATNFRATNTFCGLVELQNAAGNKIPLLAPEFNFVDDYPLSNRVTTANRFLMGKYGYGFYSGPPLPQPLTRADSTLCTFYLEDYFQLKKPGEYKLTVWPKIYERISPTNDICKRIDIPPVTVTIRWNGMVGHHSFESQYRSGFLKFNALPVESASSSVIHPNVSRQGPPTSSPVQVNPGKFFLALSPEISRSTE